MLWRALRHIEQGHYIDIGAQHPEVDSVSKAFYDRGWRGVHVEPVAEFARLLIRERPGELVLEAAVAETPGTCRLNVFPGTGLSTVSDEYASLHSRNRGFTTYLKSVRAITLTQVFEAASFRETHWLKIDVEGAEYGAIKGWDATRYRPWILVIEAIVPLSALDNSHRWTPLLANRGYAQVYFDGLNRWFVREESRELAAAFSAPPNCFDGFITAREFRLQQELERANRGRDGVGSRSADAARPGAGSSDMPPASGGGATREGEAVAAMKLRAQELGRTGRIDLAESILLRVLQSQPDDAEGLGMLAIIDSERGRHALAIERGLRAVQLTDWRSDVLRANLATFIRRVSHSLERARVLRKSLPVKIARADDKLDPTEPAEAYDVIVLQPVPPIGTSRFEDAFSLWQPNPGRIHSLSLAGSLKDKVQEVLECVESDVLAFVQEDDVPLEGFGQMVSWLQRTDAAHWAFARARSLDALESSPESAYGRYRQQLERLPELPCLDFALFEQSDVTGGTICMRRAVLERIAEHLPDLPFSVRTVATFTALEFGAAMVDVDAVARPASSFERDVAASASALPIAFRRLLANAAGNTNAPMPREWGVVAWSLPVDQAAGQDIDPRNWDSLLDEVASLERRFADGHRWRKGVNLVGMPLGMFGLAENMRAFVRAADLAGIPNSIGDLGGHLDIDQSDLRLLNRLRDRLPYRASIVFANPDTLWDSWPAQLRGIDRYRIGYWFWEADCLPKEWSYAFDLVDEIWVATEFVRRAVARSTGKPVVVMPYPMELEVHTPLSKSAFGLDEDVFWFLITFDFNSFVERKNPYAAIRAFRAAFRDRKDRVGLVIKTINGKMRPDKLAELHTMIDDDQRIVLRDLALPRDEVIALLNAADCYVSLHRSEGLGLGLLESMFLGKPVIGTAYSGNIDFMNEENSCLAHFSMVPVKPGEFLYSKSNTFHWAEADEEHAACLMRRVRSDPQFRQSIARRAQADVCSRFDPRAIGRAMRKRLGDIGLL